MLKSVSKQLSSASPSTEGSPACAGRELFIPANIAKCEDGTVTMTFGLMAILMCIVIGGAVDLGRWLNARDQTIAAIDSAVLAAGRALQTGATVAEAKQLATRYYIANTKNRIKIDSENDTVAFEVSADKTTVKATGFARIRTPFIGLADMGDTSLDYLQLFNGSEAPEASTKSAEDLNVNREIALMLDVSGSMCDPCTKRDAMKVAAKDLVNIVIKDTPSDYWTKVAVIPFSGDVRPPSDILAVVTNGPDSKCVANCGGGNRNNINGNNNGNGNWGNGNWGNGRGREDDDDDDNQGVRYSKTACVAERKGNNKHTDDAATSANDHVMNTYTANGACFISESATIKPLSSNKSSIISMINGLETNGGTAGHLGTAWSYYMLSPNWAPVLDGEAKPEPYETPRLKKTAILMTDGEYNRTFDSEYNRTFDSEGIAVGDRYAGPSANGNSSSAQAIALCNQMKNDGIEVYTVGFDLHEENAINMLRNCASDTDKAYLAENGEALKQVFRDIAVRLTELHLLR